jgi:hypothetical protein
MSVQAGVDLAGGINSRTGQPYRFRHGWILRDARPVTGRQHLRGLEQAEERKAGVIKPPRAPSPPPSRPIGPTRFRHSAEMENAQAVRGRQHMRGLENAEIAREHQQSEASRSRTNRLVSKGFGDANARYSGNISQVADKMTASLRGRRASDYQHLTAAKLHTAAARYQSKTAAQRARHLRVAAMHRGIANRTPGRGTRTRPVSSPAKPGARMSAPRGKASETATGRRAALKSGHALPPAHPGGQPGFPVTDAAHWDKALKSVGRAGSPARRAALRSLLIRTAPEFGKTGAIKGSWLAASAHSNTGPALEFSMRKLPVASPSDLVVVRGPGGTALIRHRNGGTEIGTIARGEKGWVATIEGRDLEPRNHQRTSLADLIGNWNRSVGTPYHLPQAAGEPLQPAPRQTPLMAQLGIPAQQSAVGLATQAAGSSDGPRTTDSDDSTGNGLNAKGQAIYKKLKARGFPDARAMAFAKRAQNFGGAK